MKANVNYKGMNLEDVTMNSVMNYNISFNVSNDAITTEMVEQLTKLGANITFYTNDVHVIVGKKECEIIYNSL